MIPPGKVQVPGFLNADIHKEVIIKGANGLGIEASPERLSLMDWYWILLFPVACHGI